MSFLSLYDFAEAEAQRALEAPAEPQVRAPVEVEALREKVVAQGAVTSVVVHAVELDPDVSFGHIVIEDERTSPYDEQELVARIRFVRDLNRCWARFVICKELMHVYDSPDEVVNDRERFYRLLREIEARRIDASALVVSEFRAEWMALLILCPRVARDSFKADYSAERISPYEIALRFRIPEACVASLMGDYYEEAYETLIAGPRRAELAA